jgi:transcription antitermination factor NusG
MMERRLDNQEQHPAMPYVLSKEAGTEIGSTPEYLNGTAWFAIQTVYKHEFRALRDLTAKGFTAYLPILRETRRWTDRTKVIEIPAFSGYLFLRHDSSLQSRSSVLNTFGVFRMLPDNHRPAAIADVEIDSLRRALNSNVTCAKCELPQPGTMVRVKSGVLVGVQGQIVRVNNKSRLVISVASISQAISMEVDVNEVEVFAELSLPPSSSHLQTLRAGQTAPSAR